LVGGVVVLVALYGLARTLSTTPPSAVILPILASNSQDLEALTRMVGDESSSISPTIRVSASRS